MKKQFKGLFFKIYGLILVPSLALLILSVIFLKDNYKIYETNKDIQKNTPIIRASSNLLSGMQVERGMSVSYINGANNWNKIIEHRKIVDKHFSEYINTAKESFSKKDANKSIETIKNTFKLREKIQTKQISKKKIVESYTTVIRYLMHKIDEKIAMVEDPELIKTLVNINELSEAKENGGLLRANLSAILTRKKGISNEELNSIFTFNSKFHAFSRSTSIKFFSSISKENHKLYLTSPEHNIIKDTITEVIATPEATDYSIEGTVFFSKITTVLNLLKTTINSEIDHLESVSIAHLESARSKLIFMTTLILSYFTLATFYTLIISIKLVKDFRKHLHTLNNKSMAISLITSDLNSNSKKVFEASNDQSQGIEETSAAVHEINKIQISTNELVKDGKVLTLSLIHI